jgi:hypothetical protein
MTQRLHPESWKELRQLVQLHGKQAILNAITQIENQHNKCSWCGKFVNSPCESTAEKSQCPEYTREVK